MPGLRSPRSGSLLTRLGGAALGLALLTAAQTAVHRLTHQEATFPLHSTHRKHPVGHLSPASSHAQKGTF